MKDFSPITNRPATASLEWFARDGRTLYRIEFDPDAARLCKREPDGWVLVHEAARRNPRRFDDATAPVEFQESLRTLQILYLEDREDRAFKERRRACVRRVLRKRRALRAAKRTRVDASLLPDQRRGADAE